MSHASTLRALALLALLGACAQPIDPLGEDPMLEDPTPDDPTPDDPRTPEPPAAVGGEVLLSAGLPVDLPPWEPDGFVEAGPSDARIRVDVVISVGPAADPALLAFGLFVVETDAGFEYFASGLSDHIDGGCRTDSAVASGATAGCGLLFEIPRAEMPVALHYAGVEPRASASLARLERPDVPELRAACASVGPTFDGRYPCRECISSLGGLHVTECGLLTAYWYGCEAVADMSPYCQGELAQLYDLAPRECAEPCGFEPVEPPAPRCAPYVVPAPTTPSCTDADRACFGGASGAADFDACYEAAGEACSRCISLSIFHDYTSRGCAEEFGCYADCITEHCDSASSCPAGDAACTDLWNESLLCFDGLGGSLEPFVSGGCYPEG